MDVKTTTVFGRVHQNAAPGGGTKSAVYDCVVLVCCRSYRCDCVDGYRGANCDTADHCQSAPCRHGGTCVPLEAGDGYSCRCDIEFQGPDCRHETPCNGHGKRCYNDGVCRRRTTTTHGDDDDDDDAWGPSPAGEQAADDDGEFYCECQPGYSGARCQDFDPCSSGSACVNGGTCQVLLLSLLVNLFVISTSSAPIWHHI